MAKVDRAGFDPPWISEKDSVGLPELVRLAGMNAVSAPSRPPNDSQPVSTLTHAATFSQDASGCARKIGESVTTRLEKRFVAWGTPLVPGWLQTDHLTRLTLVWAAGNLGFALAATQDLRWLLGVAVMIVLQYLTDLFDGAVGRARETGLVRWGFYADHLLDTIFLGSLVASGAIVSPAGLAGWWVALGTIATGFMASSFLEFGATGKFSIYKAGIGPTELRGFFIGLILLVVTTGTDHLVWSLPLLTITSGGSLAVLGYRTGRVLRTLDLSDRTDGRDTCSSDKAT